MEVDRILIKVDRIAGKVDRKLKQPGNFGLFCD